MSSDGEREAVVRIFFGSDREQFESFVQFYDAAGLVLTTKHLCSQGSSYEDDFSRDYQVLDLESFYFYEWQNVGRIECHSDCREICLSKKLRPKTGTIEFMDERRRDLIKRGKYTFVEEGDVVARYDISDFFDMMCWKKPKDCFRDVKFSLFDPQGFPVSIVSHFQDKTFTSSVRFFDAVGNPVDLQKYQSVKTHESEELYEEWTVIDLLMFLKDCWSKVAVVESRSDLTSLDRFKYVKGNVDYLIYCKANTFKKLPEYLYKRIKTRKLSAFLQDIKIGV
jgi:hypothetical protein